MCLSIIELHLLQTLDFPGGASGKEIACQCRRLKRPGFNLLGPEDPLEVGMATHSSILAWRISWTEEPGRLQSMGSGHEFVQTPRDNKGQRRLACCSPWSHKELDTT